MQPCGRLEWYRRRAEFENEQQAQEAITCRYWNLCRLPEREIQILKDLFKHIISLLLQEGNSVELESESFKLVDSSIVESGYRKFTMTDPESIAATAGILKNKIKDQKNLLINQFKEIDNKFSSKKIMFSEHHFSHAASAFYPSPYKDAIILTLDGVGEWATTTVAKGSGNNLEILKEIHFPHSIGLLYSAFTYYTGFKVNSGEYKVMGLAPYGEPKYKDLILKELIDLKEDGSYRLNMKYFNYATGLTMTNKKFSNLQ